MRTGCQRRLTGMDLQQLSAGIGADDPSVGLRAVGALRRLADQVEVAQVAAARRDGWSWEQIGDALGGLPTGGTQEARKVRKVRTMINRFSESARAAVSAAVDEAGRRGDPRVGTEHLLLGLLHDADSPATRSMGIDLRSARQALDSMDSDALAAVGLMSMRLSTPLPTRASRRPGPTAAARSRAQPVPHCGARWRRHRPATRGVWSRRTCCSPCWTAAHATRPPSCWAG